MNLHDRFAAGKGEVPVPHTHWLIDAPTVFLPAILLTILAVSPVRKYLGESL